MDTTKVLISVAPVDASEHKANPREIAADVIECARLGAGMVHLHVRMPNGSLTDNTEFLQTTIDLIRKESDIIIEASTGGVSNLTIQQRCAPLYCESVEAASLNVGSVNLGKDVYRNSPEDIKYCVQQIVKTGKMPEVEVFEIGMIETAIQLKRSYKMKDPLLFSIVLGQIGAAPATLKALIAMRNFIPENMVWGITHANRTDNELLKDAIVLGAKTVRIGFEDGRIIDKGKKAATNAELVAEIVNIIKALGKIPMTPAEGRRYFKIT